MNLDIGCGSLFAHNPRHEEQFLHADIQKTVLNRNFLNIIYDVHKLPFRDNIFDVVNASHLLEHVSNPSKALNEILRVSQRIAIIKVPHFLSKIARLDSRDKYGLHLHVFRRKWFFEQLKGYFFICTVNMEPFLYFFQRPYELEIRVFKRGKP